MNVIRKQRREYLHSLIMEWLWRHYQEEFCEDCMQIHDGECPTGDDPCDPLCWRSERYIDISDTVEEFVRLMIRAFEN